MDTKDQSFIIGKIKKIERKSRIRLILAILLSSIFAISTIYYAIVSDRMKNDLKAKKENLNTVNLQLAELVFQKDSLITVIDSLRDDEKPIKNYTIYMHDRTADQRKISKQLRGIFENKGFKIEGIEKISADFSSGIRYFHRDDLSAASELLKISVEFFKEQNLDYHNLNLTYIDHLAAPVGQIEIWIDP